MNPLGAEFPVFDPDLPESDQLAFDRCPFPPVASHHPGNAGVIIRDVAVPAIE